MRRIKHIISTALARLHKPDTDFFEAVKNARYETVKEQPGLFNTLYKKFSPLQQACENVDVQMVEILLEGGANPNIHTESSPLIDIASQSKEFQDKNYQIAKMLIEHKADIDFTHKKWSALMCAAYSGNDKIVDLLLDYGADVTLKDWNIRDAFGIAVMGKHPEVIKVLCQRYPDREISHASITPEITKVINSVQVETRLECSLGTKPDSARKKKI